MEAATRVELVMMVLQTIALPLGYAAFCKELDFGKGNAEKKHMQLSHFVKEKECLKIYTSI